MRRVEWHEPKQVRRILVWQLDDSGGRTHAGHPRRFAVERRGFLAVPHFEVLHLRKQLGLVRQFVQILCPLGNGNAIQRSEDVVLVLVDAREWQHHFD